MDKYIYKICRTTKNNKVDHITVFIGKNSTLYDQDDISDSFKKNPDDPIFSKIFTSQELTIAKTIPVK